MRCVLGSKRGGPAVHESAVPDFAVAGNAEAAGLEGVDIGLRNVLRLHNSQRGRTVRSQNEIVGVFVKGFPSGAVDDHPVLAILLHAGRDDGAVLAELRAPQECVLLFPGLIIHSHGMLAHGQCECG